MSEPEPGQTRSSIASLSLPEKSAPDPMGKKGKKSKKDKEQSKKKVAKANKPIPTSPTPVEQRALSPTRKTATPRSSTINSSRPILTRFPPEIRNTIYGFVLNLESPVKIASPSHILTNRRSREAIIWHESALLRVNKQIYHEASIVFYSGNKFVIGNDAHGSKTYPNLDGLKKFLARVPKEHLKAITSIELKCHFDPSGWSAASKAEWETFATPWDISYFDYHHASECLDMAKKVVKCFSSIKTLQFTTKSWMRRVWNSVDIWEPHALERGTENAEAIKKILKMWSMSNPSIKLVLTDDEIGRLRVVLDDLVEELPSIKPLLKKYDKDMQAKALQQKEQRDDEES